VLLFAYVFGGAIEGSLPPGVDYIEFLIPGILIQATAFRSTMTAIGLAEDLERGVVDRFRSMPMARSAVLVGRTLADLVRSVFVIVLMIGVGYLIGFRFREGPLEALGAIFAFIALTVRGTEAVQSAGFIGIFPLVFASSVFVPTTTMPDWLQAFADVSPVTVSANAARALSIGGDAATPVLQTLLWTIGILAVFIPLCVWRYRRMG